MRRWRTLLYLNLVVFFSYKTQTHSKSACECGSGDKRWRSVRTRIARIICGVCSVLWCAYFGMRFFFSFSLSTVNCLGKRGRAMRPHIVCKYQTKKSACTLEETRMIAIARTPRAYTGKHIHARTQNTGCYQKQRLRACHCVVQRGPRSCVCWCICVCLCAMYTDAINIRRLLVCSNNPCSCASQQQQPPQQWSGVLSSPLCLRALQNNECQYV